MPKIIYLQVEDNISEFDEIGEMTWCVDKINDSDIKYVLESVKKDIYETNKSIDLPGEYPLGPPKAEGGQGKFKPQKTLSSRRG